METARQRRGRSLFLLLFSAAAIAIFFVPLRSLYIFSLNDDTFSYIAVVPIAGAYLMIQQRKAIFSGVSGSPLPGFALVLIGMAIYAASVLNGFAWDPSDRHALVAVSAVACFAGGIGLFFGQGALMAALFPLVFLLFMAPVPAVILDRIVRVLQFGSAEVSYGILKLIGVPVFRDAYVFHIPGLAVEVAPQCSGIRSSLSLFLTSLLAGHLFLKSGWRRVLLSAAVVPITIVKNGIRIVTLILLSANVDRSFLTGNLHQRGGIPFFFAAMVLLSGVLLILRRSERSGLKKMEGV